MPDDEEQCVVRKVALRLMPFLCLLYFVAFLDRVNVGFAALTLPTAMLTGATAAGGIALINSVGTISGYIGPVLVGKLKDVTGEYSAGLAVITAGMAVSGILTVLIGRQKPG